MSFFTGLFSKGLATVAPYTLWIKLALLGVLLGALGAQTLRLSHAQTTIASQKATAAQLQVDIATARTAGIQEGARQQQAAQAAIDAKRDAIAKGLVADAQARAAAAVARAARLAAATAAPEWQCLRNPLPDTVLQEYRRP